MIDSLVCTFSVLKKFPQAWKCFSKISSELLICRINHYTRINFSSTSELQKTPNKYQFSSVQSLSRVRLFVTPWTAARQASLSIIILESTQTHVHRVGDAIQPSRPLSSPSPPAPNPSQHQGLFQWVNSSCEVAKVLEFQLQHQSFQRTPRTDLL